MTEKAKTIRLELDDGTVAEGLSFGAARSVSGEVVFNTGMVGYPESLTDPSYRGQILVLTYPLVGNYGVPPAGREHGILKHFESERIQIAGLVVSEYCERYSHWNAVKSLGEWLGENGVPAIQGVDTRALTKRIRQQGTMLGRLVCEDEVPFEDPNARNLVAEVSVKGPIVYGSGAPKVLAVDCGMKNNIIRCLLDRGVSVIRVPWDFDFNGGGDDRGGYDYDGLFISNGPGDPKMCAETIAHLKEALARERKIFGICLGNQLLALAAGADTYKLKYGHRSQNQPCAEVGTRRCYITSQNHGFAVDTSTLPEEWEPWFENANDGTNEGIRHARLPFMSVQFHPEASGGPADTQYLFDIFVESLKNGK
ncbi:MAG: glutamine-hydrolyzing carbamoyl-phosphate synthase small subunit [Candidatus Krumholzibacteriia bacterium]